LRDQRLLALGKLPGARGLDRSYLLLDHFQPHGLSLELRAQSGWHLLAMRVPPDRPIAPTDDDPGPQVVQHQQRADPVRMRDALVRQPLQLSVGTARVLIAGAGLAQHRPDALTAVMTNEHRQQLVGVQAIGLGPAAFRSCGSMMRRRPWGASADVLLVVAASFSARATGRPRIESLTLLPVSLQWLP